MKISKTILSPVMEGLLFAQRLRNRKVIVVLSSFQRKTQKAVTTMSYASGVDAHILMQASMNCSR